MSEVTFQTVPSYVMPVVPQDDGQAQHVRELVAVLRDNDAAMDLTPTGGGKTFQTVLVLEALHLPNVVVFCPATLRPKWKEVLTHTQASHKAVYSYNALGGVVSVADEDKKNKRKRVADVQDVEKDDDDSERCDGDLARTSNAAVQDEAAEEDKVRECVVAGGLLTRVDVFGKKSHKVSFHVRDAWRALVENGVLLVFDEVQSLKNTGANCTSAALELRRAVIPHLQQQPPHLSATATTSSDARHDDRAPESVLKQTSRSRVLLLSASPIDKEEHALQLLRLLGHLPEHERSLVRVPPGPLPTLQLSAGMQTLRSWCVRAVGACVVEDVERRACGFPQNAEAMGVLGIGGRSPFATPELLRDVENIVTTGGDPTTVTRKITQKLRRAGHPLRVTTPASRHAYYRLATSLAFRWLTEVVLRVQARSRSAYPASSLPSGRLADKPRMRVVNAFFNVAPQAEACVKNAVRDIHRGLAILQRSRAKQQQQQSGPISDAASSAADVAHARLAICDGQMAIEALKVPTLLRAAEATLSSSPNVKLVVAMNYTVSTERVADELRRKGYRPALLTGRVGSAEREATLRAFQAPSTDCRVIVGNVKVMGCGLDLDDQHGGFPRVLLVVPNYDTIMLYQVIGRFERALTKSSAKALIVYTKAGMSAPPSPHNRKDSDAASGDDGANNPLPDPLTALGDEETPRRHHAATPSTPAIAAATATSTPTIHRVTDVVCSEMSLVHALDKKATTMRDAMGGCAASPSETPPLLELSASTSRGLSSTPQAGAQRDWEGRGGAETHKLPSEARVWIEQDGH